MKKHSYLFLKKPTSVFTSKRMKLGPHLTRGTYKTFLKPDQRPKRRIKTVKLSNENRGKASRHWIGQWFLGSDTRSTNQQKKKTREIRSHQN